jgi:hypothetical protein
MTEPENLVLVPLRELRAEMKADREADEIAQRRSKIERLEAAQT